MSYLTEDEAKTKMCHAKPGNCVASGCMAWRSAAMTDEGMKGYCGLAGDPDVTLFASMPRVTGPFGKVMP